VKAKSIDWSKAKQVVLQHSRSTARTVYVRLPESMIVELKRMAKERELPYQTLIERLLAEKIVQESAREGKAESPSLPTP